MKVVSSNLNFVVNWQVASIRIDDIYDLSLIDSLIENKFDIIISFKAICEFVTKERFEKQNAYKHIAQSFMLKLKTKGIMLLADVTTYNNVSQEWLPVMMDKGLKEADCHVIQANKGYNQTFVVSHSKEGAESHAPGGAERHRRAAAPFQRIRGRAHVRRGRHGPRGLEALSAPEKGRRQRTGVRRRFF